MCFSYRHASKMLNQLSSYRMTYSIDMVSLFFMLFLSDELYTNSTSELVFYNTTTNLLFKHKNKNRVKEFIIKSSFIIYYNMFLIICKKIVIFNMFFFCNTGKLLFNFSLLLYLY